MGILSDLNEIFFGRSSDARLERMRFWTRFKRRSVDFLSLVAQGSLLTIAVVPLGVALVLAKTRLYRRIFQYLRLLLKSQKC